MLFADLAPPLFLPVPAVMMVEISAAPAPYSCDSSGRIACGEYRLMKAH